MEKFNIAIKSLHCTYVLPPYFDSVRGVALFYRICVRVNAVCHWLNKLSISYVNQELRALSSCDVIGQTEHVRTVRHAW